MTIHTLRKWNKWNLKRQRNRVKTSVRSNRLKWANSVAQRQRNVGKQITLYGTHLKKPLKERRMVTILLLNDNEDACILAATANGTAKLLEWKRHSNLERCQRVLAYVLRFIKNYLLT
uniref:RVT_N domain-containing protein n=1 Tax=Haemonchus placei TaxID=6290 RepID=A0A0N4X4Q5_HAEPC